MDIFLDFIVVFVYWRILSCIGVSIILWHFLSEKIGRNDDRILWIAAILGVIFGSIWEAQRKNLANDATPTVFIKSINIIGIMLTIFFWASLAFSIYGWLLTS